MKVVEVPVSDITVRFRLRNPSESKIEEISESISQVGLINPITIDSEKNLLAGFHRYICYQKLNKKTIPCIIKDSDIRVGELIEIDENLKRNELNFIEQGSHILRREELMKELGLTYSQGDNRFTNEEKKLTVKDLADGLGMNKRSYQLRKQITNIHPEVQDLLVDTEYADNLNDLVKLSSEPDQIQKHICNLLITGKCKTWKSAFYEAKLSDFRLKTIPRLDFSIKERWGDFPKSIMKFNRVDDELTRVINLVNHHDDLRPQKGEVNFGSPIRLHQMCSSQALFHLDYYTNPGDLILDNFNGRATTAITSLYLQRRFIGFEINDVSYNRTNEVIGDHMEVPDGHFRLISGCGCEMKDLEGESEVIDHVFGSPPYFGQPEPYNSDPRDLCNMKIPEFLERIDLMFMNLSRLIKKSSYEKKIFKTISYVLGTYRDGPKGIFDMSFPFNEIAQKHSLTLWDRSFNETNNAHLSCSLQRNYELRMLHKNYEQTLTWVKF